MVDGFKVVNKELYIALPLHCRVSPLCVGQEIPCRGTGRPSTSTHATSLWGIGRLSQAY